MARYDDPADALFDVEPKQFIAARDALAKELRSRGERDAATEVKTLRRPTVAAWALNQVARHDAPIVRTLRDAVHAPGASPAPRTAAPASA